MFRSLENLSRMNEETVEETTVDVEVRVAEEVETQTEILEEATTIVEEAETSDDAGEEIAEMHALMEIIQNEGINPGMMAVINRNNQLSNFSGIALPAKESLDTVGGNPEAASLAIESLKESIKKAMEAVKRFFINIWEKVKGLARRILDLVSSKEKALARAKEMIKGITLDPEKVKNKEGKFVPDALMKLRCGALTQVASSLSAVSPATMVGDVFGKSGAYLKALDLRMEDGKIIEADKPIEIKKQTLTLAGWDVAKAEAMHADVAKALGAIRSMKAASDALGKICTAGIKEADSVARSSDEKVDKDKVEELRKLASTVSKGISRVSSVGMKTINNYLTVCSALKACEKR